VDEEELDLDELELAELVEELAELEVEELG
jgi:hypothetical protein